MDRRAAIPYSPAGRRHSEAQMGQTGIRRTAFALLAVLIVYAALTGAGA